MSKTNEAQNNPTTVMDAMDIQAAMDRVRAGCKEVDASCDRILVSLHVSPIFSGSYVDPTNERYES